MNNPNDMWTICHDCPYWEVCEPPYNCAVTEKKYRNNDSDEKQPTEKENDNRF